MNNKSQSPRIFWCLFFLITLIFSSVLAVGSGGLLNIVPQAKVWYVVNGNTELKDSWKVYVHPMEGSLVVFPEEGNYCIALDKNKRHAITITKDQIAVIGNGDMIDVPENVEYEVLRNAPHFNRTYASIELNDGSKIKITVER